MQAPRVCERRMRLSEQTRVSLVELTNAIAALQPTARQLAVA